LTFWRLGSACTRPVEGGRSNCDGDGANAADPAAWPVSPSDDRLSGWPYADGSVRDDTAERLRGAYGFRVNRFRARFDADDDGEIEERSTSYQRVRRELLDAERNAVVGLRRSGYINDDVMKRVQRDIDLEAARLDVPG